MAGWLDNYCKCRQCSGGDDGFRCRQVRFQSFDLEAGGSRYASVNAENYRMGSPATRIVSTICRGQHSQHSQVQRLTQPPSSVLSPPLALPSCGVARRAGGVGGIIRRCSKNVIKS